MAEKTFIESNNPTLPNNLPQLPASDEIDEYPYKVIISVSDGSTTEYLLWAAKEKFLYLLAATINKEYDMLYLGDIDNILFVLNGAAWTEASSGNSTYIGTNNKGITYTLIWSNHNIVLGQPSADGNTYIPTEEVAFRCSYEENYAIPAESLYNLGDKIRELTGCTGMLTIDQMADWLSDITASTLPRAEEAKF